MALKDLIGKRTGRPPGAKSAAPWVRTARWAARNLDTPEAVPPSPLAGRLLALGRKQPDRLAVCLARLEALGQRPEPHARRADEQAASPIAGTAGQLVDDGRPRRLATARASTSHASW